MIWLKYTLTPRGYISAGRSRETGNDRAVYEVLPGSVIRGALGASWWIEEAGDQVAFDDLFGSAMTVHTAVPSVDGIAAQMNPLGWSRAKYPVDAPYLPPGEEPMVGRTSGRGWSIPNSWMTAETRAGLVGGVAEDGKLFMRRASRSTVSYSGHLALDDETPEQLVEWLERNRGISIGGQRSIMGRCVWRCERADDPFPEPGSDVVALTALQPVVLVDRCGANSLDLASAIREVASRGGADVEVVDSAIRPIAVEGWHGRAGIPKPMEWALDAGSWALLRSAQPSEAWRALKEGLGVRRLEGYGAVALTGPDERPEFAAAVPAPVPVSWSGPASPPGTATPVSAVASVPNAHAAGGDSRAEDIRELILRVTEEDRPQAVRNLLELARALDAIERRPMGGPLVARRLEAESQERWCRAISEEVVSALLGGLRTKASRTVTVQVLEEMR